MVAATQAEYDVWNGHAKDFSSIGDAGKNATSEDPTKRGSARGNLENLILKYNGLKFGRHDVDSHVLKHLQPAQEEFANRSVNTFAANPIGIIEYAYTADPKKFAENYLSIDPTIIGLDAKRKPIRQVISFGSTPQEKQISYVHNLYFLLNEYAESKKDATTLKDLAALTRDTSELLEQSLIAHFQLTGSDKYTAERNAKLIRETYDTSTPQEAYQILTYTASQIKNHVEELLPENKRADYAHSLLIAKAGIGNTHNLMNASQDLYKIVK